MVPCKGAHETLKGREWRNANQKMASIQVIREGKNLPSTTATRPSLLQKAQSWEMTVNIGGRMQFPQVVQKWDVDCCLKIQIISSSQNSWSNGKSGGKQAFERKNAKSQDLLHHCRGKGWQAWLFPVQVSSGEFPAHWNKKRALGIKREEASS